MLIDLEAACRAVCDRCNWTRWEPILQDGEWWHSAEETVRGTGIPPEPCAASAIRNLAKETE